jgi:hypothetical protein
MVFNFLYKFLSKPKPQKSITFTFTGTNSSDIQLDIQYKECNPEYIASLIYALNHGLFLGKIVQNLNDHSNVKNNNEILSKLDQLYVIEQQNDLLIKPLEAFEKNAK